MRKPGRCENAKNKIEYGESGESETGNGRQKTGQHDADFSCGDKKRWMRSDMFISANRQKGGIDVLTF